MLLSTDSRPETAIGNCRRLFHTLDSALNPLLFLPPQLLWAVLPFHLNRFLVHTKVNFAHLWLVNSQMIFYSFFLMELAGLFHFQPIQKTLESSSLPTFRFPRACWGSLWTGRALCGLSPPPAGSWRRLPLTWDSLVCFLPKCNSF